ncbi:hypothetical protein ES703_60118 [subsurface metagenome]
MKATDVMGLSARLRQAANRQLCPECNALMTEVDRLSDDRAIFVWYECSRDNCSGQWLQKTSAFNFNKT